MTHDAEAKELPVKSRRRSGIATVTIVESRTARNVTVAVSPVVHRTGVSRFGPFGSKQGLQLEVIARAAEVFQSDVTRYAADTPPGLGRLRAVCRGWIDHIARSPFPGGCFWTAASCEFDGRPGPVRDAVAATIADWTSALRAEIESVVSAGELSASADPDQIVFELNAVAMGLNQHLQLHRDPSALERARRAMDGIVDRAAQ